MSGRGSSIKKPFIGLIIGLVLLTASLIKLVLPGDAVQDPAPSAVSPSQSAAVAAPCADLNVYALDVGQGDCFVLVSPEGMTMLIDAGEAENSEAICGFLTDCDIASLDVMVATHPHSDHIGAMAEIIEEFDVDAVYMPQVANDTETYERLIDSIEQNGVDLIEAWGGVDAYIDWGESCRVQVLSPLEDGEYSDMNDWSIMLRVEYGENSMLFTGDAHTHAESFAMYSLPEECFDATVLKVGHHGSTTSSSTGFLSAVSPEIAIIPVGADNEYGHPDPSTLDKLRLLGAEIYRTDQCGNIRLIFNGSDVRVEPNYKP